MNGQKEKTTLLKQGVKMHKRLKVIRGGMNENVGQQQDRTINFFTYFPPPLTRVYKPLPRHIILFVPPPFSLIPHPT